MGISRGLVKTKSIYEPEDARDGFRVLVMRYWPRGVKRDRVDRWMKGLGTEPELIRPWKRGEISWEEFRGRYTGGLQRAGGKESLEELAEAVRGGETITLLCSCRDEGRCHRSILKDIIDRLLDAYGEVQHG